MNRQTSTRPSGGAKPAGGNKLWSILVLILGGGLVCSVLGLVGILAVQYVTRDKPAVVPTTGAATGTFAPAVTLPTLTPAQAPSDMPTVVAIVPEATQVPSATVPVTIPVTVPVTVTAVASPPPPTAAPAPSATPAPVAEPTKKARMAKMRSPDYGMQAFLWWRAEVAQRDVEMVRDAGFRWVKQDFPWREIEGLGKGRYDWMVTDRIVSQVESIGPKLIVRLDSEPTWASGTVYPNDQKIIMGPPRNYQDFADFAYAVASRYKGRVAAYQIWNEPNLAREWGGQAPSPENYTRLLKAGYEAIKRADPYAIVISAGMAPTTRNDKVARPDTEFLKGMYAAGAGSYFDALGAHGAGYKAPPEMDPADVANNADYYNKGDVNCPGPACRIYCFRHVEDLHQIMADNGQGDKRVVVLEFGWTIDSRPDSPYRWHAVTEEQQADYFVRAYQYAKDHWQPWIAIMSLIYLPDIDWTEADEQYWWSIAVPNYPQFYPRKAYRDLAVMAK